MLAVPSSRRERARPTLADLWRWCGRGCALILGLIHWVGGDLGPTAVRGQGMLAPAPHPYSMGPAPYPLDAPPLGLLSAGLPDRLLPLESLYPSYLAGPKESRLGTQFFSESDQGGLWDSTLGGRLGLFRKSSLDGQRIWQMDVDGAAILRLDAGEEYDLSAVDFRAGAPLALAWDVHRLKLAYYHTSAHLGDEFLLKNPTFQRLNYTRDALVLGYARYLSERIRVYGEANWAFYHEVGEPWQFQFGCEYAPTRPTGVLGAPFFAINAQLREEVDFGGTTTLHAGWAWREAQAGRLLRTGFFFQTGKSHLFEFYDTSETQIGVGLWYDF